MVKKREPVAVVATGPHAYLHCMLSYHCKNTASCIVLRAKGICKKNCGPFFKWVKGKEELVKEHLQKYENHPIVKLNSIPLEEAVKNVLPRGDFICEKCNKPFPKERSLKVHMKRSH